MSRGPIPSETKQKILTELNERELGEVLEIFFQLQDQQRVKRLARLAKRLNLPEDETPEGITSAAEKFVKKSTTHLAEMLEISADQKPEVIIRTAKKMVKDYDESLRENNNPFA